MHIKKFGDAEIGEMLLLRREPDNIKDKSAVAVMKETDIVGHVPYNISSMLSHFLRRECNKSFVQVTGNCVNRRAGYGMETIWTSGIVRRIQEFVGYLARFHSMIHCMHALRCYCVGCG